MKKKMTAAELMAQLNANSDYVAMKKARDDEFQRKVQEYARAEVPILKEFHSTGLMIDSVWDFVNGKVETGRHVQALPVLLAHLERSYPDAVRDGIARAMAIPAARFAWPTLVNLYKSEQGRRTKSGLAVALSNITDDETLEELIELVKDTVHGESRVILLSALERSFLPRARGALMDLGSDPELHKEVQLALRGVKRAST